MEGGEGIMSVWEGAAGEPDEKRPEEGNIENNAGL